MLEEPIMKVVCTLEKYDTDTELCFLIIQLQVNPDHDCCYISYGGEEISMAEYDVIAR